MTLSDIDFPTPGEDDDCRVVREILDLVADKWSLYVIATLKDGPVRFNELRRRIDGISQRMLTITLRGLERDGLVKRTLFATIPPRVDYELTDMGRTLFAPVMALVTWANTNQGSIQRARVRYDESQGARGTARAVA
ncbi:helix-turn-helix domain-containing protein [Methylobacterium oryzae]|jgi:DNA-binding HxlR family transcriptional regulator|uniref:winged helix-turn-helix transcriptional regulator n=1 Tax=Methylobacterium oryzae TaxID=334852 RepID=UPI002F33C6BE